MPIQLNYTDDAGRNVAASYWFARKANVDSVTNTVDFLLYGYVSLAAKNAGKPEFLRIDGTATWAALGITGASTLAQVAAAIHAYALANILFFSGGSIV